MPTDEVFDRDFLQILEPGLPLEDVAEEREHQHSQVRCIGSVLDLANQRRIGPTDTDDESRRFTVASDLLQLCPCSKHWDAADREVALRRTVVDEPDWQVFRGPGR